MNTKLEISEVEESKKINRPKNWRGLREIEKP